MLYSVVLYCTVLYCTVLCYPSDCDGSCAKAFVPTSKDQFFKGVTPDEVATLVDENDQETLAKSYIAYRKQAAQLQQIVGLTFQELEGAQVLMY